MMIIYNCYGGTHSSILTMAVHLGKLPSDRIPSAQEILDTEYFNKLTYKDMGKLLFHGVDSEGNRIYTIGRGTSKVLIAAMENLAYEMHNTLNLQTPFIFVNTSPVVPLLMTLGGFFSRGLKIDFIGVPLLAAGARQSYNKIVSLAERTKLVCRERAQNSVIMDIDAKGRLSVIH